MSAYPYSLVVLIEFAGNLRRSIRKAPVRDGKDGDVLCGVMVTPVFSLAFVVVDDYDGRMINDRECTKGFCSTQ